MVVDEGEECDCGLPGYCKMPCCDPNTCKLRSRDAECFSGACCDLLVRINFKSDFTKWRNKKYLSLRSLADFSHLEHRAGHLAITAICPSSVAG